MNYLRLGVNLDHVATLRNARGDAWPDPVRAAKAALAGGADGITVHLREDRRHIRDRDVFALKAEVAAPLNLEMAATEEMLAIGEQVRPPHCCLVPERREEITTEGGLDVAGSQTVLAPVVARLRGADIRVSLFVDPDRAQIDAAAAVGAQAVELHTGAYARAFGRGHGAALDQLEAAAHHAHSAGLEVHAGHGLTFENVMLVSGIAPLSELNIGHFLMAEAVFMGLEAAVRRMRQLMARAREGLVA